MPRRRRRHTGFELPAHDRVDRQQLVYLGPRRDAIAGRLCSIRALTIERHEAWLEDHRYLNMDLLKERKREALRQAA
jgi:hypothetical protein